MNSVKLIALDIDGTLYNKDGVITSYNKEMIRKAVEKRDYRYYLHRPALYRSSCG